MDTRRSTPDVLGSIMSGTTKQDIQPVYTPLEKKEKVTFNLSVELLSQLEESWIQARKTSGAKISKTSLVELALELLFSQLEDHQEKTLLYTKLRKRK
jgi:hypothetical protein